MVLLGTGVKNVPPKAWGQRNDWSLIAAKHKAASPHWVLSDWLAPEQFTGCPQWEQDFAF